MDEIDLVSVVECIHCEEDLENDTEVLLKHGKLCTGEIRHGKGDKYLCFTCAYRTPYSGTLRRHIRAHIGDHPYTCFFCEYRSNQRANLMSHVKFKHGYTQKQNRINEKLEQTLVTEDVVSSHKEGFKKATYILKKSDIIKIF
uniref:Zinc finger protein 394 n=1 Tax=Cacopsylla melanoneura TaxID=428564 RepID=A0A8D8YTU6_9HEMI